MSIFGKINHGSTFQKCEPVENCKVKAGLAYSPAMVMEATEQGIAVSGANIDAMFFDGTDNPSFDLATDQRRGVDANDVWNASREARARLINAHLKDKRKFG
ncbi:hypothetical protein [Microvirus mar52]|uniref:Uncharacterized protein n=1 Tax=Microvirus mar52 TaxID=2851188 RepID=A0A8F5MJ52_9VIRU|nr:hypothetical protein [Microvirus mar52]